MIHSIPLPDDLWWLAEDIQALARPLATALPSSATSAPGDTLQGGIDLPEDAPWAEGRSAAEFLQHHADGLSCVLQLNMAQVPQSARKPEWPTHGVLWVFLIWSTHLERFEATVQFDPRSAETIPWRKAAGVHRRQSVDWREGSNLPWCTPATLPAIVHLPEMQELYDEWIQSTVERGIALQVGGWGFLRQGDFDLDNQHFMLAIKNLHFGDAGEVYVFFDPACGFWARADSA